MATPGRKTKRTPEVEKRIIGMLRFGSTQKDACAAAGISWETFDEWRRAFPEFSESVTRAEGECAAMMAAKIYEAGKGGDWRAAEAWLKRRRRDDWAERPEPRDTLLIDGEEGDDGDNDFAPEQIEAFARIVRAEAA